MPENTPKTSYHQLPDHAFWTPTSEPSLPPPPPPSFKGRFVKGANDPRRHVHSATCGHKLYQFSKADCSKGFWAAVESITTRHPHMILKDGRHAVVNFLRSRTEQAF